ncbi:MAG: hypothetical protein RJA36_3358 [Pseudomonadota bacterium]|jgi:exodeoxyribonuclease VII small subunit
MKVKTFKEAYGVLQRHAQTLREQDEPNIDDLLSIVTESVSAYKLCQERIDAVEQALEKALGSVAEAPAPAGQAAAPARAARRAQADRPPEPDESDDLSDGDIPF